MADDKGPNLSDLLKQKAMEAAAGYHRAQEKGVEKAEIPTTPRINEGGGVAQQARILADEQKLAERGVKPGDGLVPPGPGRGEPPTSSKVASQDAPREIGQAKPEQAQVKGQEQSLGNLSDLLKREAQARGQDLAKAGVTQDRGEAGKATHDSKTPSQTPEQGRAPEGRTR